MNKQLIGLLSTGLLVSGVAQAQVIDDFSVDQAEVVSMGSAASNSVTAPVEGATRTITVNRTDGTLGVRASVGTGAFLYSQDTGVSGTGEVNWTNLPNLDFSVRDTLVLQIRRSDFAAPISLTVVTTSGSATVNRTIPELAINQSLSFDFSGASGVNLSEVVGLRLFVDGSNVPDLDLQVDELRAVGEACQFDPSIPSDDPRCVPPPAVPGMTVSGLWVSLLGLPLIAGFFVRRRRNKQ